MCCFLLSFGNPRKGQNPSFRSQRGKVIKTHHGMPRGKGEFRRRQKAAEAAPRNLRGMGQRWVPQNMEWGLTERAVRLALAGRPQRKLGTRAHVRPALLQTFAVGMQAGTLGERGTRHRDPVGEGAQDPFCWDPTLHWTTLWSTYVTSFNSLAAPGDGSQPPLRTLDTEARRCVLTSPRSQAVKLGCHSTSQPLLWNHLRAYLLALPRPHVFTIFEAS